MDGRWECVICVEKKHGKPFIEVYLDKPQTTVLYSIQPMKRLFQTLAGTLTGIIRFILSPFILLMVFAILAFLAFCEWVHVSFGWKRIEERMADREGYRNGENVKL